MHNFSLVIYAYDLVCLVSFLCKLDGDHGYSSSHQTQHSQCGLKMIVGELFVLHPSFNTVPLILWWNFAGSSLIVLCHEKLFSLLLHHPETSLAFSMMLILSVPKEWIKAQEERVDRRSRLLYAIPRYMLSVQPACFANQWHAMCRLVFATNNSHLYRCSSCTLWTGLAQLDDRTETCQVSTCFKRKL